jgi:hypothetical protein
MSKLTMDSTGNLYGTTQSDGAFFQGSVFKLTRTGPFAWQYTSLHDFSGGSDGYSPYGNVILDSKGNLYGTTAGGGSKGCFSNGCGLVFMITP